MQIDNILASHAEYDGFVKAEVEIKLFHRLQYLHFYEYFHNSTFVKQITALLDFGKRGL